MKKIILLCTLVLQFFIQQSVKSEAQGSRGLFVTVIQDPQVLSSRQEITKLINFSQKAQIKTLFVQIYRANKSWFPSKIADQTPYEACFKNVSEDPFALLIREAHKAGIEVHAWLNMLSLSNNKNARILKKYGKEILTSNLKKKRKIEDYKIDNQYFLEPGDLRVRKELSNIVKEILYAYPELDGIQFDYIRYPDRNPAYGYTKMNIERFKKASRSKIIKEESLTWQNWKRSQVTEFVAELTKEVRLIRPQIQVSATGCAPFVRAYYEAFQDWPFWLKNHLVDFVTVMTYSDDIKEFKEDIIETRSKVSVFGNVNLTVGAYKMLSSPDIFTQELKLCEESGSSACVILHYGSLLQNPVLGDSLIAGNKSLKNLAKGK